MPHVTTFKCDGCGHAMDARNSPPNFTVVPGPAPVDWIVAVYTCSGCGKPLGISSAPTQ